MFEYIDRWVYLFETASAWECAEASWLLEHVLDGELTEYINGVKFSAMFSETHTDEDLRDALEDAYQALRENGYV